MLPELPDIPFSLDELEESLDRAHAEGKRIGLTEAIVWLVGRRFGAVPETLKARLETIGDADGLQEILDGVVDATSLSQLEAAIAGG